MFHFRPGRGFWVQSAEPYAVKAATTPAPADPGDAYVVPLEKGWNIIANPSRVSIDWAAVQAVNGITQGLWRWDGYFAQTDAFEPTRRGEAYYFMNATGLEALTIPRWSVAMSAPALPMTPRRDSTATTSMRRQAISRRSACAWSGRSLPSTG